MLRGVILDVDGTLVDSNDAHAQAWVQALAEHGYAVPYEQVRRLIGMGGDKLLPKVTGLPAESSQGIQISMRRGQIFEREYLPHLKAFPHTRALLQHMRDAGLRLVVASSAEKDELQPLLEIAGASDLIEQQTSSDDADQSKPDPDIVQAALTQLGLQPNEVLMLGDTPYDVEAAAGCNIDVVGVRCGGWDDDGLSGAIAIYDDPTDLLAHYAKSPFAQS